MIKKISLKLVLHKSQTWQNLHRHNFNIVTDNSISQNLTSCPQPLIISPPRSSQYQLLHFLVSVERTSTFPEELRSILILSYGFYMITASVMKELRV